MGNQPVRCRVRSCAAVHPLRGKSKLSNASLDRIGARRPFKWLPFGIGSMRLIAVMVAAVLICAGIAVAESAPTPTPLVSPSPAQSSESSASASTSAPSKESALEHNFDTRIQPNDLRDWLKILAAE